MGIRGWSSDVCSSDLARGGHIPIPDPDHPRRFERELEPFLALAQCRLGAGAFGRIGGLDEDARNLAARVADRLIDEIEQRSEEHTSELQSLMRISYAVFCLKKKTKTT